ncbi:MAG TPA: S46 family peptidase [Vicinamibacteria bacterium]
MPGIDRPRFDEIAADAKAFHYAPRHTDYFYSDEQGRAIAVDSRGILEALSKVFEAEAVLQELTGS